MTNQFPPPPPLPSSSFIIIDCRFCKEPIESFFLTENQVKIFNYIRKLCNEAGDQVLDIEKAAEICPNCLFGSNDA